MERDPAPTTSVGAQHADTGRALDDLNTIINALEWADKFFVHRDEMNAAVHCGETRWSDLTLDVSAAIQAALRLKRGSVFKTLLAEHCICGEINARHCPVHNDGVDEAEEVDPWVQDELDRMA